MSSSSAASMLKPLSKADSCLLSLPSAFASRAPYSYLSFPSKFIRFHLSYSLSSAFSPSLSLKKKTHSPSLVTFVAQTTSDWASEDDTMTIDQKQDEPHWENQELSENESRISDWEAEGEDPTIEGSEAEMEESDGGTFGEGEDEEPSYVEPNEDAKLFVGNLPYDVDSQKLAMLFEKAGVVEIAEVIYNRETDQSRGFGFVTMSTVEEAEKAVDMFNRYDLEGRLLTVNKAAPRGSKPERRPQTSESSFRIYVGNLPWDVDNTRLEQIFSEHGKVVEARVLYDRETGRSRGFGFVTMADETGRDDAIAARDGQTLDGRTLRVNIAEDRPRRNF